MKVKISIAQAKKKRKKKTNTNWAQSKRHREKSEWKHQYDQSTTVETREHNGDKWRRRTVYDFPWLISIAGECRLTLHICIESNRIDTNGWNWTKTSPDLTGCKHTAQWTLYGGDNLFSLASLRDDRLSASLQSMRKYHNLLKFKSKLRGANLFFFLLSFLFGRMIENAGIKPLKAANGICSGCLGRGPCCCDCLGFFFSSF